MDINEKLYLDFRKELDKVEHGSLCETETYEVKGGESDA